MLIRLGLQILCYIAFILIISFRSDKFTSISITKKVDKRNQYICFSKEPSKYYMKLLSLLLFFGVLITLSVSAQPADPATCLSVGTSANNKLTFNSQGTTTFTLSSISNFESTLTYTNNINLNVLAKDQKSRVYIAGEMTYTTGGITTNIPLSNFRIEPVLSGTTATVSVTQVVLTSDYQQIIQNTAKTGKNGDDYLITIKLLPLNTYLQSPGNYQLKLHIRLCQY